MFRILTDIAPILQEASWNSIVLGIAIGVTFQGLKLPGEGPRRFPGLWRQIEC